jgi:branched-chain amino acid transport system permease protein
VSPGAHPAPASPAAAALRRKARISLAEILFWLLPVAAFFLFPFRLPLMAEIAILGLFALSLDLVLGYAGIVSLGHAAFFGVGAYTAGLLAVHGWGEPVSGLLAGGLAAGLVGFVSAFLVLRGSDLTRLMVTLGIALMLYEAANQAAWLTGGADGLSGVTLWPVLGLFEWDIFGRTAYCYTLAVVFLSFLVVRRVIVAPFGLTLRGIKGNRLRMAAIGAPVNRHLVRAYTIGAIFAGIAGALLAQTTQFVSLDVLAFHRSADVLLVLLIGGSGAIYGGFIGAVAFRLMQEFLSGLTQQYWQFWMGAVLVLLVLFARGGVIGLARKLLAHPFFARPAFARFRRKSAAP